MTEPLDPSPFLHGNPFPGNAEVPYPRADPEDVGRLPAGTWDAASIPVGVRLEFEGDADAVRVSYRTTTNQLGPRGEGGGKTFEVWANDATVVSTPAVLGPGTVDLPVQPGVTTVYLPEGMRPTVCSLIPVNGTIRPVHRDRRWLAYGDSIVAGWSTSSPALAWPARLSRRMELDLCNFGYAGTARGELPTAEQMAKLPADVISVSYGTNCWSTIPHSPEMLAAGVDAFLRLLRLGHMDTPIVVTTPIVRPGAEDAPNRLGASLAQLRDAMAQTVTGRIRRGDTKLTLLDGRTLMDADLLVDGIHPGDEGHALLARSIGAALDNNLRSGKDA